MKHKLSTLVSILLAVCLLFTCFACNGEKFEDFYEFDLSSITTEQLVDTEQKIEPTLKNLGDIVADAKYSVTVTEDGKDVTADVYNAATKIFSASKAGAYTFTFTVLDKDGNPVKDASGNQFVSTKIINVVMLGFEPKANAGTDVTIDDSDEKNPKLIFGDHYMGKPEKSSQQYRITGVNFAGAYKITYEIDVKGHAQTGLTRLYFGVDRTDALKRDDNIYLDAAQGNFGAWFFNDEGPAVYGADWTGTGWKMCSKSVSGFGAVTGKHTISFVRLIENTDRAYAHYVIEYDGAPFTSLTIAKNYTDKIGVWVESEGVAATISIKDFQTMAADTEAPAVAVNYAGALIGEEFTLSNGVTVSDNSGYGSFAALGYEVKNAAGEAQVVTSGKFTPDAVGEYSVKVTATDLSGNVAEKDAKLTVDASFGFGEFAARQYTGETTFVPTFNGATAAEKDSMSIKLLKGGVETDTAVSGNAASGFKFTIANEDAGLYVMRVSMKAASGNTVTKDFMMTVVNPSASVIDFETTTVARTNVGHIVYYTVTDGAGDDQTAAANVSVLKGEDVANATDVTEEVYSVKTTKTLEENVSCGVFRPLEAGVYYIKVSLSLAGVASEGYHQITVADNTEWVYGYKLDMGNGKPQMFSVGKDAVIYEGVSGDTSKFIIQSPNVSGDWTLSYKVTDLKYNAQGKFFATLGIKGGEDGKKFMWNDITIGGNKGDDLWGYETCMHDAGWITYQWRGVWQEKTSEFSPLDENGDPISYVNAKGETIYFEEAPAYTKYATGTHEYTIQSRWDETLGRRVLYFFIDGKPEVRHVLPEAHGQNDTIDCVVFMSQHMEGFVTDIKLQQD